MESLLDSMTITLSRPFIIKGESRDTITIREPKLRDRIMFSNDKSGLEERTATMLARLANLEREDLYALPACDYDQMEAAFNELVKLSERPTSDIVILIPFIAKKLAIPPDTQMDLPYRVFNFYVNEVMKIDGYFSKL